ncbi:hypothetical protein MMC30_006293 [Trapelia coarctata]|nr:hypothetical protein [Trapelia coarctata]
MDDKSLLSRLNALKKSSVTMDASSPGVSLKGPVPNLEAETADDLIARFRKLTTTTSSGSALAQSDSDHGETKEETAEELLAELNAGGDSKLNRNEESAIKNLLKEAQNNLSEAAAKSTSATEAPAPKTIEDAEDEEAATSLQQILDELDSEKKYSLPPSPSGSDYPSPSYQSPYPVHSPPALDLGLPSTPTAIASSPSAPSTTGVESALDLPSAPTAAPSRKPKVSSRTAKPTVPKFTDEEVDSWCVICNDDATVKCIGCEGDLYCAKCWKEGHVGKDAGLEERGHRWAKYSKK